MTKNDLLGSFDRRLVDRKHLIDDTEQIIKRRLNRIRPMSRGSHPHATHASG